MAAFIRFPNGARLMACERQGGEKRGVEEMVPRGLPDGSPKLAGARGCMLDIRGRRGIRGLRPALSDDPVPSPLRLSDVLAGSAHKFWTVTACLNLEAEAFFFF